MVLETFSGILIIFYSEFPSMVLETSSGILIIIHSEFPGMVIETSSGILIIIFSEFPSMVLETSSGILSFKIIVSRLLVVNQSSVFYNPYSNYKNLNIREQSQKKAVL